MKQATSKLQPWELPAGAEMDKAMYKLFNFASKPTRAFSQYISTADSSPVECLMAACLHYKHWGMKSITFTSTSNHWRCEIYGTLAEDWVSEGEGETLAVAFCRAILREQEGKE